MKVLVIPDVHGRKFWRKTISDNINSVDKIIFLGDYLDPYHNEIENNPELMECDYFEDAQSLLNMLNDIVSLKISNPNKVILLTGNHSDSYIWSKFVKATRTDYKNWELYHKFFSQNLELFNLVWVEDNVIFSHAGISEDWAKVFCARNVIEFKSVMNVAEILQFTPVNKVSMNETLMQSLGHISYHRGGSYNHGSCEWADIHEHLDMMASTIEKIIGLGEEGVFQVFGHTQLKTKLISDKWACLDCRKGFIIDTLTWEIVEAK